jgi:hypothetical protein
MRRAYIHYWSPAGRTLLIGLLCGFIFLSTSENRFGFLPTGQLAAALAAVALGTQLGLAVTSKPKVAARLGKLNELNYSAAAGIGFVLTALWAFDNDNNGPFVIWFGLAAILEAISSGIAIRRRTNAS